MSIQKYQAEIRTYAQKMAHAESKLQGALERLGEGAQVVYDSVPYEVAYWRGKWRLKCLVSKSTRERLQRAAKRG